MRKERTTAIVDYELTLTKEQLLEYGKKMSELDQQEEDLSVEQKASAANFKARMSDLETERKRLSKCVRSGKEQKTGECDVSYNYEKGVIEYFEIETQVLVSSRKMTPEERQLSLFGGDLK